MRIRLVFAACVTAASSSALLPGVLGAQSAFFVYQLGKDTVAVEQFTRSATGIVGEMVQRTGAAVMRFHYDMRLGRDGRPTTAAFRRLAADGAVPPNAPSLGESPRSRRLQRPPPARWLAAPTRR